MAFPTSSLTNNQVHKEGNRAFVYDSALGVWDQVRETDRTENKILQGEIGSAVTGFTGIKNAERWLMGTTSQGNINPITVWAIDPMSGAGKIGSSLMSHSSGIFTFPSTGIWHITFHTSHYTTTENRQVDVYMYWSIDSGSNWTVGGRSYVGPFRTTSANVASSSGHTEGIFDVTNTSTHQAKFAVADINNNVYAYGISNHPQFWVIFERIGDT